MIEREAFHKGKTVVLGHRGAMGYAPENTLASFARGVECGADEVEMDIHVSKDGELIVIHDAEISRTTDGRGRVQEMMLAELKKVDAGVRFHESFRGERIPTLKEVLDWAKGRVPLVIEVKGSPQPHPQVEEKLLALLHQFGMVDEVIVISFHHAVVRKIKELEPQLMTGILYEASLADTVGAVRAAQADSARPNWDYWTAAQVAEVKQAGIIPSTWNPNTPELMERLVPMGFTSIGSNYPDKLRQVVDRLGMGMRG